MAEPTLGFIGGGQMARAIAAGLVDRGLLNPAAIAVSDPSPAAVERFREAVPSCRVAADNRRICHENDIVVLAVKPQIAGSVGREIHGELDGRLIISIVAGLQTSQLSEWTGSQRIVRVMPNTPCLIGAGAVGVAPGPEATIEDLGQVEEMFASLGTVVRVDETQLDAVTGLSGSGPAYVFTFIQALADGGVLMGLPRSVAHQLAVQTVLGSAILARDSGEPLSVLSDRVASPGGTTIYGLAALEAGGLRSAVINAVRAATERAQSLRAQPDPPAVR